MIVEANGKKFEFPDGTSEQQISSALDEYFYQGLSEPQQEESSLLDTITGADRETKAIEGLREVTGAPELGGLSEFSLEGLQQLGANFTPEAFKAAGGLLLTSDPKKQAKIIKENYPNATFQADEKGNVVVGLDSGNYVLNAPGISTSDVTKLIADMVAFTPAGRAGTVAKVAAGSALTDVGMQAAANVLADEEGLDPTQALTSGVLGGASKAAENLITSAARAKAGHDMPEEVADLVKFADENDLPLATTDVIEPETFAGKMARSTGEKIPGVGTGDLRAQQQQARKTLIDDFSAKYGDYDPSAVYESLLASNKATKREAGKARQEIVDQMKGRPAMIQDTLDAFDDEIDRLLLTPGGNAKETADMATVSKLEAYRNDLAQEPTFDNLEQIRTQFREGVRGDRQVWPNQSEAAVNGIYNKMTSDLDETIDTTFGGDTLSKWKKANTDYAIEADKVKNTRLKSILNKGRLTPEAVNALLYSKNPSEVKTLYKSLTEQGKQAARAGIVAKAIEKADKPSGFSVETFANELGSLSKNIDVVFEGEEKAMIKGIEKYLNATREAAKADVVTPTGQGLIGLAPIADIVHTGGAGTLAGLGYGAIARAYESKAVRNALLRLEGESPGTEGFERALKKVRESLNIVAQNQNQEERQSFYF